MLFGIILLLIACPSLCVGGREQHRIFRRPENTFEHLTVDPETGNVYIGAVNSLFQLTSELREPVVERTGPKDDSKDCLPPVTANDCAHATSTDNHNKLLLVDPYGRELITCGSLFQGICEKRNLTLISSITFRPERPVDTQYVAANDPNVTTVGLVAWPRGTDPVLFVGRGYTSKGAGGIPPITTRNLRLAGSESHPIFSYEDTAKLAVAGRLSEYNHHFVKSFIHRSSVYFLFYRRDLKSASREYKTYISRICLGDTHYYSYVELPLECQTDDMTYNLLQAAYVGRAVLFATFAVGQTATAKPTDESAFCLFPLSQIDGMINRTRDLCYTKSGKTPDGEELAYIEYEVKSSCTGLTSDTLSAYPCGYDHTPSPMASHIPITVRPVLTMARVRLVAVAISVEMEHTIAFLGDSKGLLHKVSVRGGGCVCVLGVNGDLAFDRERAHLYVTTRSQVVRLPLSECPQHPDCASCLAARDPYCGWCILQGRSVTVWKCGRAEEESQWQWSYGKDQQCLKVQSLTPANISRQEKIQVRRAVCVQGVHKVLLPPLQNSNMIQASEIILPRHFIHVTEDHVTVKLLLLFHNITVANTQFTFYDCSAVQQLSRDFPCRGCVSSRWGCNWCVLQHHCTHNTSCEDPLIIFNENMGAEACPCVHSIQGSALLPVNVERKITLEGRNLHFFHVRLFRADTRTHEQHLHTHILFTLYNCSVGRTDCSRCQTADTKYACAWCGGVEPRCVYQPTCQQGVEQTCPGPLIHSIEPISGLLEGGTGVTITGSNLGQRFEEIEDSVLVADVPCRPDRDLYRVSTRIVCYTAASDISTSGHVTVKLINGSESISTQLFTYQVSNKPLSLYSVLVSVWSCWIVKGLNYEGCSADIGAEQLECLTGPSNQTAELPVTVMYGVAPRILAHVLYSYTEDPNITLVSPASSFLGGGRLISVHGQNLDAVQSPRIRVQLTVRERQRRSGSRLRGRPRTRKLITEGGLSPLTFYEWCQVNSSTFMTCRTPAVGSPVNHGSITVHFIMDNLSFDFNQISPVPFTYQPDPLLKPLNADDPSKPYRHKPGSVLSVEGENLDLAITKEEVVAMVGEGVCVVRTLTGHHLYCEPPLEQPGPRGGGKRDSADSLPEFIVQMGKLNYTLGTIQYDAESPLNFPLEAQIGLGMGASIVALIVLIIVLIYRRKSKQALRDYKKVQIQLENLETSVRDRCKKEFTDLMTEMMDLSSDLVGTGIPFLDYKTYAERVFFPGHRESPLQRDLDVPESRRQTVEQGLVQLSNLLNSKLFLTKFIHTLESQRTFSPRDRAYVASLLTVSLHGKLEYYTDILKTLLNHLVEQNVARNPKLMLRRTETVVEKLLTNWMSICLYTFLRDSAGESLYMLFRAIKHQVDKGPVDAVSGKAKYTLNDNRLLREDVEYRTLTLNVLVQGAGDGQPAPVKVLDCDTITQVKEKIIDQIYKGVTYSLRPHVETLDLEWRSGLAGHLILSDEDLTSVLQGNWKRLNTLQHYKVADGATVALVSRLSKHIHQENHDYMAGEKTPMLEDADEGGIKAWHLVKGSEEPELPRHRRGSVRERERAKAIPEIYLTRLLSMKGTLQKFVDDLFQVILSTSRPVPLAVKYFFDLLDEQAVHHGIIDSETIHIWKTNSLPLRFWINIIKNPHFTFDVQVSDNVDAVLSVIAQTFMDSCTIAEHKLGRDSPINKLLYARDIPRYKQMVESLPAVSGYWDGGCECPKSFLILQNYSNEMNCLVALHELYKYINKYYDQIITALEEDPMAQKMQLGYRLQQIAASVENKVTDL
uniref:Plexin-B1 n=1 Tax=Callorhinchus milii TaxID=7868 RepID=A0A4W3JWW8_CALMI